ncbi:MAG: hypothetical protein ABJA34_01275 [Pseudonocardiales bacterium]
MSRARRSVHLFAATLAALALLINAVGCGGQAAAASIRGTPAPAPQTATPAAAFLDSVGVNTHLGYTNTPYAQSAPVQRALQELGVRHVRENFPVRPPAGYADRIAALAGVGIRTQLTVGAVGRKKGQALTPVADVMTTIGSMPQLTGPVEAIEGPNEWDIRGGSDWPQQVRRYQETLHNAVRGDPRMTGVVVVAPALSRRFHRAELGNLDPYVDWGNNHTYSHGAPTVGEYADERTKEATVSGGKPVVTTETGYTSAVRATDQKPPVTDAVAAVYIPRLFAAAFRSGTMRTFLYELLDERGEQGLTDEEAHFGLLYSDLTPKPAYTSLQRLLGLVTDGDSTGVAPSSFSYSVGSAAADHHELLLSRRDGTLLLVMWRDIAVDRLGRGDDARQLPIEVKFARPVSQVDIHRPSLSAPPVTTLHNVADIRGNLGADLVVLRIDPRAPGSTAEPMAPVPHGGGRSARVLLGPAAAGQDAFGTSARPEIGRVTFAHAPAPASHGDLVVPVLAVVAALVVAVGVVFAVVRRRRRHSS